jgi:hypothetical protein
MAISKAVEDSKARLLIIDPITAHMGGADSHKDAEVRGVLSPLTKMADTLGIVIIGVMHLSKTGNRPAMYRVGGSIGFIGISRTAFSVIVDVESQGRRYLGHIKNNFAPEQPMLAFRLKASSIPSPDGPIQVSGIDWEDKPVLGMSVERLMNNGSLVEPEDQVDADEFVAGWPIKTADAMKAARANGINDRTLRRAVKRAGIVSVEGDGLGGKFGPYEWHKPAHLDLDDPTVATEPSSDSVATVATVEKPNDLRWPHGGQNEEVATVKRPDELPVFNPRLAFTPPDPSR